MSPEYREMWADLYRFFEKCALFDWKSAKPQEITDAAAVILNKYPDNWFVRDVLSYSVAYTREIAMKED